MTINAQSRIHALLHNSQLSPTLLAIAQKVLHGQRISFDEGVVLYEEAELGYLGILANFIREKLHGDKTYFNRNFHIEPTNFCVYTCKFCSYSRLIKQRGVDDGWEYTADDMMKIVKSYDNKPVTEVHIVGGVLPQYDYDFFVDLLQRIKQHRPDLHIKGFTPVEYHYIFKKAKMSYHDGLAGFKAAGLQSMPGGGAEIFDEGIRNKIARGKCNSTQWLEMHETAHNLGIPSNATMLYGHIESYAHRVDHMERLRQLQDKTGGFNCFIPLKFRSKNNEMADVGEVSVVEDLRNYAIARIYLDNFKHLKAYWPMIGRTTAQLSLNYGVNDIDGTIDDTTKIYSMAGSEEQTPSLSTRDLVQLIKAVKRRPIERNSVYDELQDYNNIDLESLSMSSNKGFIELPVIS